MNAGIYVVNKKLINYLKKEKNSFENYSIPILINEDKCYGKIYHNYFIDIGLKKNLNAFKKYTKK